MEGPTPVSALIHAATMVTAGVFLVCRMSPLMEYAPAATNFILIVGATTAFFAATVGLVQNDIKRVVAYSTCSQLGYMFVAAGLGAYSVAMFHLLTHAFFKAMLFLGAGSVIHAMHHEQDMRNYGNLRKKIPYTFAAMMIGTLAITGVGIPLTHIGFAGFLSKDAVIESAYGANAFGAFWVLIIAACLTSFYSWRLMFMTFYGAERGNKETHAHAKESPLTMLLPLGILGVGAIFSGMVFVNSFFGDHKTVESFFGINSGEIHAVTDTHASNKDEEVLSTHIKEADKEHPNLLVASHSTPTGALFFASNNNVMDEAHHVPTWVKISPFVAMVFGFFIAWLFYIKIPGLPKRLSLQQRYLYKFLLNKWYFDEVYDLIFVRSFKALGKFLWVRVDGTIIDGTIDGVALKIVPLVTRLANKAQSGFIFHYAFVMIIGVSALITWFAIGSGS